MEEFGLDLSNILSEDQIQALGLDENQAGEPQQPENKTTEEEQTNTVSTESLGIEDLFGSESVGDDKKEKQTNRSEDTATQETNSTSSNTNLYSSIAEAFRVDSIFPDLSDDEISEVKDADSFRELVDKHISAQLDERQKRVDQALNDGVEPSEIRVYESSIDTLNKISEDDIIDESDKGENLRKGLIYNSFLSKGMSKEKAIDYTQRSIDSNKDIEDAKDALADLKSYYTNKYKELTDSARQAAEEERKAIEKQANDFKKLVIDEGKAFGELTVDKATRNKIYEAATSRKYKNGETGEMMTAIQKAENDNHNEFMKNLAYAFVLTDGFKNLKNLSKPIEREAKRKGIKELESTLNSTVRNPDGSFKFVSGVNDNESYSNWSIDL